MSKAKKPGPAVDEWTFVVTDDPKREAKPHAKTWFSARAQASLVLGVEPEALTCTKRPR